MNNKIRIAIIGAGVSGLTCAQELRKFCDVDVYEKETAPGGLVRCKRVNGSLFHICGGHIFNSKRLDVLEWFWKHFDQCDFHKEERNSMIIMQDGRYVPYPIEDNIFYLEEDIQKKIIRDLLSVPKEKSESDFDQYLRSSFGEQLFELYFKPYNEKVWGRKLNDIPLSWLQGKMPQPSIPDILFNNINRVKERQFVHSTFWYENNNGSQFIVDTLSKGVRIHCNCDIEKISYRSGKWYILDTEYDKVIFCGNVKSLPFILEGIDHNAHIDGLSNLASHGTTSVFCEIDDNPYTWIYLPSQEYKCHRIICTGNLSKSNNASPRTTGTIEFTGFVTKEDIMQNLAAAPLHPKYLDHNYCPCSYPIQTSETRSMISNVKSLLREYNFYLTGRFAEWEYYNMDIAIGSAIDLCKNII